MARKKCVPVGVNPKANVSYKIKRLQTMARIASEEEPSTYNELMQSKSELDHPLAAMARAAEAFEIQIDRRKEILFGLITELVHTEIPAEQKHRDAVYHIDSEGRLMRQHLGHVYSEQM